MGYGADMTKFKVGGTKWTIREMDIDGITIFRVFKNGEAYETCNGNDYQTKYRGRDKHT